MGSSISDSEKGALNHGVSESAKRKLKGEIYYVKENETKYSGGKIMGLLDALKKEWAKAEEEEARKKKEKELLKEPVKLKCPFCGYKFEMKIEPDTERYATHIGKGLIFLPWGIHSALKGKRCPRCRSKIG